jgi:nitrite reductase/ring-hydroxylating ferredoxin subunit
MMDYVEIAQGDQIAAGTMKSFLVNGKDILLVNYDGKFYALGGKCTHAGEDLSKGKLEGKIVTCAAHGSKFDVTTGISVAGPKIGFLRLKTANEPVYEIKVEGNSIKVNI